MKYYIGYFNKPWDMNEFTVICATPNHAAALFIFSKYKENDNGDTYKILTASETMDKKLIF